MTAFSRATVAPVLLLSGLMAGLAGCGQKGDLYLPDSVSADSATRHSATTSPPMSMHAGRVPVLNTPSDR